MKTCVSMKCTFMLVCKEYNFLVDRGDECKTQQAIIKAFQAKDSISLEELKKKEQELREEYNEEMKAGRSVFADHALKCLQSVRYVIGLIKEKNK